MGKHNARRTRTVTRSGFSFNVSGSTVRKGATGATVLTATAAVGASLALGPGAGVADAGVPAITDALAGIHTEGTRIGDSLVEALGIESGGYLGGVALGPQYLRDQITGLLSGLGLPVEILDPIVDWVLDELGLTPGHELAISILPGAAVAIPIGEGTSATAISILGVAMATDGITQIFDDLWDLEVDDILGGLLGGGILGGLLGDILDDLEIDLGDLLDLPTLGDVITTISGGEITRESLPADQVFCLGGFAFANSGSAGSCVNIAALIDGRYNKPTGEVQLGLTNPLSILTYLTDPTQLGAIVGNALSGQPIYLLKDFGRLSFNGPDYLAALTSSYGFETVANGAPITVNWLGSTVGLFPGIAKVHGDGGLVGQLIPGFDAPDFVNYLSLPSVAFGTPTGFADLIPSLGFSAFNILDLYTISPWNTNDLFNGQFPSLTEGPMVQILSNLGDLLGALSDLGGLLPTGLAQNASSFTTVDVDPLMAEQASLAAASSEIGLGGSESGEEDADSSTKSGDRSTPSLDGLGHAEDSQQDESANGSSGIEPDADQDELAGTTDTKADATESESNGDADTGDASSSDDTSPSNDDTSPSSDSDVELAPAS